MKINLKKNKLVYVREVVLKYKDKPVDPKFENIRIFDTSIIYELFKDLQNETKEKLITVAELLYIHSDSILENEEEIKEAEEIGDFIEEN